MSLSSGDIACAQGGRKPRRIPIPKQLRYFILERDGYACRYCGADASEAKLHVDHHTPVVAGGTNDPENLRTACQDCNLGKSAFLPSLIIPDQRRVALAVMIYKAAEERFGPLSRRIFEDISDLCLSEVDPDPILQIVTDAITWPHAHRQMLSFYGWPEEWTSQIK